jgi:hypothetical protein
MNDKIYDIDFNRLSLWHTPKRMRKPGILAWMKILVSPFVFVYQDLLLFRIAKLYQLKITPQKVYLELMLNNRYDYTLRRIYIDDGLDKPPTYIYQSAELKPLYIYQRAENKPHFIYTSGESGDYRDDFVVFVPLDIAFQSAEMISLIKAFKLAGTKFKIQRF